jgi:phage major head subunit gpT-like protein
MGRVATVVPSSTRENKYGWLGKMPNMREWIGPRVAHAMAEHSYAIENKHFERTIAVDRNDIEDDNLGVYTPLFAEMGMSTAAHPEPLVFDLLKNGFAELCYDGQYFLDSDHPVLDETGTPTTWSNTGGGSGTPWFLLSTARAIKPLIFQSRKAAEFVSKDRATDEKVFEQREFRYGVDARYNVGFGFPQMAYGSKQTLDATSYAAARAAMMGLKGDYGRPLGIVPDLLVVPPALEGAARRILETEYGANGATNEWKGTAQVLVSPWLA